MFQKRWVWLDGHDEGFYICPYPGSTMFAPTVTMDKILTLSRLPGFVETLGDSGFQPHFLGLEIKWWQGKPRYSSSTPVVFPVWRWHFGLHPDVFYVCILGSSWTLSYLRFFFSGFGCKICFFLGGLVWFGCHQRNHETAGWLRLGRGFLGDMAMTWLDLGGWRVVSAQKIEDKQGPGIYIYISYVSVYI